MLTNSCPIALQFDFTRISFSTNQESFHLWQSNEPRRNNKKIGSVVCSILAVSEKVCVRWSWQDNLTELNLMFDNNSGTKRFRFISEHSLTFADAIQGVDGHKLLIPAISWGTLRPRQARSSVRQKCDIIPLLSCNRDISGPKKAVGISDVGCEVELILARAAIFTPLWAMAINICTPPLRSC